MTGKGKKIARAMTGLVPVDLPAQDLRQGGEVFKALRLRRTARAISDKKLPLRVLSDLLWAAYGVNRKKGPFGPPGRTAASASNSQEIDLYVALEDGAYLYDAFARRLLPVASGDLRKLAIGPGQRPFPAGAPAHLIFVADINRLSNTAGYMEPGLKDPEVRKSYYYVDTGLIAGNVYIYAASKGLACWFHNCDKRGLRARLGLRGAKRVLFAQTVGYPLKK